MPDTDIKLLEEIQRIDGIRRGSGDFDNSLPTVVVDIPDDIKIPCPKSSLGETMAVKCSECRYFFGVVQKSWSNEEDLPWDAKHAISCNKPVERTVTRLVV